MNEHLKQVSVKRLLAYAMILLVVGMGFYQVGKSTVGPGQQSEQWYSPEAEATYIAGPFNSTFYFAKNHTGYGLAAYEGYELIGTNDDDLIQYCIDKTTTDGGLVYVKEGAYSASVTLKNKVHLVLESGAASITVSINAAATAVLEDWNAGRIRYWKSASLMWDEDLDSGALTAVSVNGGAWNSDWDNYVLDLISEHTGAWNGEWNATVRDIMGGAYVAYLTGQNTTATTCVMYHGLGNGTANFTVTHLFASFNCTDINGYAWGGNSTHVTVTISSAPSGPWACYAVVAYHEGSPSPPVPPGTILSRPFIGMSTRFTEATHTYAQYQAVADVMTANGMTAIRIGSNNDINTSTYTWHSGAAVNWFLANTSFTVLIDRFHLFGVSSLTEDQWNTIDSLYASMAVTYAPYGTRVVFENPNEYSNMTDYNTRMQHIISTFRTNVNNDTWFCMNKKEQPWPSPAQLYDPAGKMYQGYHYYFNYWSPTSAMNDVNYAIEHTDCIFVGTEEGADSREGSYYTNSTVAELSSYLQSCYDLGYGNFVWMNHETNNMAEYTAHGIVWPS